MVYHTQCYTLSQLYARLHTCTQPLNGLFNHVHGVISAGWWAITLLTRPGEHKTTAFQAQFITLECLVSETFCQPTARERKTPFPLVPYYPHQHHVTRLFLYSLPSPLQVMMRVRTNSAQLIFHGARVLAFVRSASWVVWERISTIEGWWGFHPPSLPLLHFSAPTLWANSWAFLFFGKSYH